EVFHSDDVAVECNRLVQVLDLDARVGEFHASPTATWACRDSMLPKSGRPHSWPSEFQYLWSSSPPDGRPRDHPDLLEGKHVGICVLLRKGLRFQDVRHHEARLRQRAVPVSVRAMEIDLGTVLVLEDDRTPVEVTSLRSEE